jgi:hypothetical protein
MNIHGYHQGLKQLTSRGIRCILRIEGVPLPGSFAPIPKHRSKSTQCCQLEHAHNSQSQPPSTNYEWIEELEQTVNGMLYILAAPEIKV